MPKSIVVTIAPDGAVKIDAVGYAGPDCERATKALRESLGVVTDHRRTADYSRPSVTAHVQNVRAGQ